MPLTTCNLQDESAQKAAREALVNSKRLFLGGYLSEAMQVTGQLVGPGPWALSAHTDLADHLAWVHAMFCWANQADFPGFGAEPARKYAELKAHQEAGTDEYLDFLVMSDRVQNGEAGDNWSEEYFESVAQMVPQHGVYREYGKFVDELDIVLKQRLRTALDRSGHDLLAGLGIDLPPEYASGSDLRVADASQRYSTRKLADILARCVDQFPHGLDYMAKRCFIAAMILALSEDQADLALVQLKRALADDDMDDVLQLAAWPPLFQLLGSGSLREHFELDDEAVATYLAAFASRRPATKAAPSPTPAPAHDVIGHDAFRKLIEGCSISNTDTCLLEIPECNQPAIAVHTTASTLLEDWKTLRGMVDQTGRWPVVTLGWGWGGGAWKEAIRNADIFMREPYQSEMYEGNRGGLSPSALVAGSSQVDLEISLAEMGKFHDEPLEEDLDFALEELESVYGKAPKRDEVLAQVDSLAPAARMDVHQYLHQWLLAQGCDPQVESGHIDWFQPNDEDTLAIVLLPTKHSYEAPAYLHWFGAESIGTEVVVAMLEKWHERYGAELACHYGTMLQFYANSRPTNLDDALCLAREQELIAPCTTALPGVSLLDHALALMASDTWFLHERP